MSVKKNDSIFAIMSLVLVGTVGSTAYYAVNSSTNAKAKQVAETAAETAVADKAKIAEDLNAKSKDFATQISSARTELNDKTAELNDLQSKHLHLTEMYESAIEVPADAKQIFQELQITKKNLEDLQRRNATNEDLITEFLAELNVATSQDALATISAMKTKLNNQIAEVSLEPAKNLRETGDNIPTTDDPELKQMLADGQMTPVARPPAGTETRKPVVSDKSELLADFERIRKRNEFLLDRIQKAEKIMAAQSELLARLTKNGTTTNRVNSLKPSMETTPNSNFEPEPIADVEVTERSINDKFKSGPSAIGTISGIDQAEFDVVPIPATDSDPRFPADANATLIESYFED